MTISRRQLLKYGFKIGASAAALGALPRPLYVDLGDGGLEAVPPIESERIRELAFRAVEAARDAGAAYADVRLTHTRMRRITAAGDIGDEEQVAVGVRALVAGRWGFASSPMWSRDEVARLGREAAYQAKSAAAGPAYEVVLADVPVVHDEHWTMPVEVDPFEVSPFEIADYLAALTNFVSRFPGHRSDVASANFYVQEKAFASSAGSYCTQRLYRTEGELSLAFEGVRRRLDALTPAGMGWELFTGQQLREEIRRLMGELEEDAKLPVKPVEVGRYEVVCDAISAATLLESTLGTATQLDRVLGFEANASGTSYLSDPLAMLGSHQVGVPALTLTANRNERGAAGTVRWDDEGVESEEFTLVRDGILADFQTTRESASWLAEYYRGTGRAVRSHGCAVAPSALEIPLQHVPNLRLAAGPDHLDFDSAIAGVKSGLAVRGLVVDVDFQGGAGLGRSGLVYEIKGGQRVARVVGAGFLFRSAELWKDVVALGGHGSVQRFGMMARKGEPAQATYHSVAAPPVVFGQFTVIDPTRKA
jgi:TldD protein